MCGLHQKKFEKSRYTPVHLANAWLCRIPIYTNVS